MASLKRREILAMLAAIGSGGPAIAWGLAGPVQERLPWAKFRKTGDYARLVGAVRGMKANPDLTSPNSWLFWANIHQNHCPHGKDYFLAWHRGYLSLFEQQLRALTKSSSFRLPYWDYFADPKLPIELTAGNAATNPLFETRKGAEVGKALVYAAFGRDVTVFERSVKDCFESKVEQFHNNVHNLIGGKMATMQSPQDLIFWMHHANIDRLWTAWALAGQGRQMPGPDKPYWGGQLDYATGMSVPRAEAMAPEKLGYRYADLNMPGETRAVTVLMEGGAGRRAGVAPPPAVQSEPAPEGRAGAGAPPPPPRVMMAPPPAAAAPAPAAAAPVPFRGIWLGRETRSVRMPLRRGEEMPMMTGHHHGAGSELSVVLDAVTLTQMGEGGGYFYKLYLDLDDLDYGELPGEDRLIGTVGPFQIAAALSHAEGDSARLELPAADLVARLSGGRDPEELGVTFVRVDADGAPGGSVINIGAVEFRGRIG